MRHPRVRLTNSGDPDFLDGRASFSKPFYDYFFGVSFVLLGSFTLLLTWAFSAMVDPELKGGEWWSAVTGTLGFRSGIIVSVGTMIGGVRLLIRSPKP